MNAPDPGASPTTPVRVLVVDYDDDRARWLTSNLDLEPDLHTVGRASSVRMARQLIPLVTPHVLLINPVLATGEQMATMPDLQGLRPDLRMVVLMPPYPDRALLAALATGTSVIVPVKPRLPLVTQAVRAAARREPVTHVPPLEDESATEPAYLDRHLTAREFEILSLLAAGQTNAVIARDLFLSVHTVRTHVANLSRKLGAHSKLQALSVAVREGILPRDVTTGPPRG